MAPASLLQARLVAACPGRPPSCTQWALAGCVGRMGRLAVGAAEHQASEHTAASRWDRDWGAGGGARQPAHLAHAPAKAWPASALLSPPDIEGPEPPQNTKGDATSRGPGPSRGTAPSGTDARPGTAQGSRVHTWGAADTWLLACAQRPHRGPPAAAPAALGPAGLRRRVDTCHQSSRCPSLPVSAHAQDGAPLTSPDTATHWGGDQALRRTRTQGRQVGAVNPEARGQTPAAGQARS